ERAVHDRGEILIVARGEELQRALDALGRLLKRRAIRVLAQRSQHVFDVSAKSLSAPRRDRSAPDVVAHTRLLHRPPAKSKALFAVSITRTFHRAPRGRAGLKRSQITIAIVSPVLTRP